MSKILAIKGHSTRGKEVIELLEMLGGKNQVYCGKDEYHIYFIDNEGMITTLLYNDCCYTHLTYQIFTLDEFYEKYPYKVGDVVKTGTDEEGIIKQIKWVDNDIVYWVESNKTCKWAQTLSVDVLNKYNRLNSNDIEHIWATTVKSNKKDRDDILFDSIIWHLRNSVNNGKQHLSGGDCERYFRELTDKVKETIIPSPDITTKVTDKNNCNIGCPDGYEFYDENGNLIGTNVMMKPKKPTYPKTIKECVKCINAEFKLDSNCYEAKLFANFYRLIICRDAYWKIAGEQMGLNKPWEPEYVTLIDNNYHTIQTFNGEIVKSGTSHRNAILAFPTVEMRDVFYENFKVLIENCKELL